MAGLRTDRVTGLPVLPDDGTGARRVMGRLLTPPALMAALPEFRQYHAPIPPADWEEIDLFAAFAPPVLDQGPYGSCVGHGGCTAFTMVWMMQGEDLVRFSSCYLYGLLNGGRDEGASVGATIQALQSHGICLEATVPEGMIYESQFPPGAHAEAARYKLTRAYRTTDPADVATALQMGYAVADSVNVGNNFARFGPGTMAGVDRGPGNHCVAKGGMVRLAKGWAYLNQNSWGARWGDSGKFLTTDAHIQAQSYYEAVVFRAVSAGPAAPPAPLPGYEP